MKCPFCKETCNVDKKGIWVSPNCGCGGCECEEFFDENTLECSYCGATAPREYWEKLNADNS